MKPKTRTEKEVVALSRSLSGISEHQKNWAMQFVSTEHLTRFRGKPTDIVHFVIVTTKGDWQVLRHFYLYATYRYKKLHQTMFAEVMQQWFKDGRYVFMSRARTMGYCMDSWCLSKPMEIRRGWMGGYYQCDPRQIGYTAVYYSRVHKRFSYLPKDHECEYRIDSLYRAVNTHTFSETLFRLYPEEWKWAYREEFLYDKKKMQAMKIAIRYKYDFMNTLWRDMVEMLIYLGKDICNPSLVCPKELHEAHDKWSQLAASKRRKMNEKLARARQLGEERRNLRRMEEEAKRVENQKALVTLYPKAREPFFALVIAENELEIKVLQSVQEFMEEGKEMSHCVFSNGYYDINKKPDCLILSAKVNGTRTETIEVNLSDYSIVQCRGKHNQDSPYHERVLNLMNTNMGQVRAINERLRRKRKRCIGSRMRT